MKLSWGLSAGAILFLSSASRAQTVPTGAPGSATGQVERSLRKAVEPPLEVEPPRVELPPRAVPKPPEASRRIRVSRVEVTGNRALSLDEIRPLLPEAGERTAGEVQEAADRVAELYRARGFALVHVSARHVGEGGVEFSVVEGRVGRVLVEGNEHFSSDFILGHLEGVAGPSAARLQDLERGLLLLNEYGPLRVRARLRPGDVPGSADLHLSAEDRMPLTLAFDFDNYGSETVGESRAGATVGFHDLWESGHSLSLRGVTALDTGEGGLGFGRVDYMVPFQTGTRILLHGSLYDYEARGDLTVLDPAGRGTVFGTTFSHAFVRGAGFSVWGDLGLEFKNLEQELIGFETSHDRLRILIVGARTEILDGWAGRWVASLWFRQGLGAVAGGLEDDDPDASRLNADGSFSVLNFRAYRLQKLADWIHLIGKFDGQWANEPLVVSEQFSLGGYDSVRGYPPFEFMGDRGCTATLEARFKLPFLEGSADPFEGDTSAFEIFQLAAFVDTGGMRREDAGAGERDARTLSGGGVGVRIEYPGSFSLRFDVAWPLTGIAPSDGEEPTFYVSVVLNIR